MKEKIKWTKEQEEILKQMIDESEIIGFSQGYEDATKDLIIKLESIVFELKKRIYKK